MAIDAGAAVIDVSIMGLGERAGIADLIQLSVVLHTLRGEQRFPLHKIPELGRAVGLLTGVHPDALRPVMGRHAFYRVYGGHPRAMDVPLPYSRPTTLSTPVKRRMDRPTRWPLWAV
ncbi:protein of unknown function [Kyrpidia spormannii]|uniref:Pyruvate carboxyltransferase domain-containing protein n=1 Tax=Kyrpidia spormannii TaxID=2055160 RepID=A0A6F9E257_9BACL|nr:protein of unknown function [Kyrpidia spormannii]